MHAREWISTMVTEYIAYSLLHLYELDRNVKHALDKFDFYIFPVVNPDGMPPIPLPHRPTPLTDPSQASSTPKR
jgi:murein tripeptide amidase MpaA